MDKIKEALLKRTSDKYEPYYNGVMSYTLYGHSWDDYVKSAFPNLSELYTSENLFKVVIDLYAESLMPAPRELQLFRQTLVSLLCRGHAPVIIDDQGKAHFPEHYEMLSDGDYHVAAVFTRALSVGLDYVTFANSDGELDVWAKPIPTDLSPATREDYKHIDVGRGTLLRFALTDHGFGRLLAPLQDRVNHSIIDQTLIAEMYARPFWYLLNTQLPPRNPYLPKVEDDEPAMIEHARGEQGRVFTTSSPGPFGQLTPPTLNDMVAYHSSLVSKVSQVSSIPEFYLNLASSGVPSGVALKVLSKRFNQKVARIRDSLEPQLLEICEMLGLDPDALWPIGDDLLQDSLDMHGISLKQMGYPTDYIASVVTPGVDLDQYATDGLDDYGYSSNG